MSAPLNFSRGWVGRGLTSRPVRSYAVGNESGRRRIPARAWAGSENCVCREFWPTPRCGPYSPRRLKLSVVIAAYNEEATLREIVARVRVAPVGPLGVSLEV